MFFPDKGGYFPPYLYFSIDKFISFKYNVFYVSLCDAFFCTQKREQPARGHTTKFKIDRR